MKIPYDPKTTAHTAKSNALFLLLNIIAREMSCDDSIDQTSYRKCCEYKINGLCLC